MSSDAVELKTEESIVVRMEKCATEECENETEFYVCEACVDAVFDTYEHQREREYYRE